MGYLINVWILLTACAFMTCQGITVKSCSKNSANDIVTVNSLFTNPTPLQLPGDLSLSASFTVNKPITGNMEAAITISRKFGPIWIDLPCVQTAKGKLGSCTYRNMCEVLARVNGSCPRVLTENKIPCTCPIPAGTYIIPPRSIPLDFSILGFQLPTVSGSYQASIRLTDTNTMKEVVCYDVGIDIVDPPSAGNFGGIGRFFVNLFG